MWEIKVVRFRKKGVYFSEQAHIRGQVEAIGPGVSRTEKLVSFFRVK